MPVTAFQAEIAKLLSVNRRHDSYLAGGAALHFEPNSIRYSQDLDYFHDSEIRVSEAFSSDRALLIQEGIDVKIEMNQPGYIRVIVRKGLEATKIEWAHDSAWRFMPTYFKEGCGFTLHPVDLAINKVLALAGRDEPRDYLDVLYAHKNILALPGLIWAACGKDPGFTPNSILDLLRRKGKYRERDFSRLRLNTTVNLQAMKDAWIKELEISHKVCKYLPAEEVGCLYYDKDKLKFVVPDEKRADHIALHFGSDGGVLPTLVGLEF